MSTGDPDATIPQKRRPDNAALQRDRIAARFGPAVPAPPAAQPTRRERIPGGTALDAIEPEAPARPGWRELVHRYTGLDLGPSKETAHENALKEQIRAPLGGVHSIAVLNLKGGVGKTAVVEALGSTFAGLRSDRVIAVDIDAGDLADRHGRRNNLSLADLLVDGHVTRYDDVRAHTYKNSSGLEALGPPDYASSHWVPTREDFVKAFSILRNHYALMLVDCPKTLKSGVMQAVLPETRALVVVTSTSIDAIQKTHTTLQWLRQNGYRRLLGSTVLAVNHVERTKVSTLAEKELHDLSNLVSATVVLPFDRHVHQGNEIGLERLSKESRRSYLEMAAALARTFPTRQPAS
ncbi:MinD/ParA family ATP-binding protein [Mycobacterium camsae]|uniref:MinD/ParA family ATP-binding protein n=1 Tax=Mycobacterium gordonae TaxID=1778 RepID=UPI001F11A085|nr:MinD/ParA family protein [Mycobacterium gordonae]